MKIKPKLKNKTLAIFATLFLTLTLIVTITPVASSVYAADAIDSFPQSVAYPYINFNGITWRLPSAPSNPRVTLPMPSVMTSRDVGNSHFYSHSYVVDGYFYEMTYFEIYESVQTIDNQFLRNIEFGLQYGGISAFTLLCDSFLFSTSNNVIVNNYIEVYTGNIGGDTHPLTLSVSYSYLSVDQNGRLYSGSVYDANIGEYDNGLIPYVDVLNQFASSLNGLSTSLISNLKLSFVFNTAQTYSSVGLVLPSTFNVSDSYSLGSLTSALNEKLVLPNGSTSYFRSLVQTIDDFLSIELVPGVSFGMICGLALFVPLTIWLLKLWLGG